MCGRYTLTQKPETIRQLIEFEWESDAAPMPPRYNIAPSQSAPVVLANRVLKSFRWGLIPSWATDAAIGNRMINARAEAVHEKPAFRRLLDTHRCLVLADGFFEWRKTGRSRQPIYFRRQDERPFAFAGLWDSWQAPQGGTLDTFTILTTSANSLVAPIHDRMPVMLTPSECDSWLDMPGVSAERARSLLKPFPADAMKSGPVNPVVNSPKIDGPECIQPLRLGPTALEFDFG